MHAISHNFRINLNKTTKGIHTVPLGLKVTNSKTKIRSNTEIGLNSDKKKNVKPRFYMRISDAKNSNYKFIKNNKMSKLRWNYKATSKQANQNS